MHRKVHDCHLDMVPITYFEESMNIRQYGRACIPVLKGNFFLHSIPAEIASEIVTDWNNCAACYHLDMDNGEACKINIGFKLE